jgi:hypothetical protein
MLELLFVCLALAVTLMLLWVGLRRPRVFRNRPGLPAFLLALVTLLLAAGAFAQFIVEPHPVPLVAAVAFLGLTGRGLWFAWRPVDPASRPVRDARKRVSSPLHEERMRERSALRWLLVAGLIGIAVGSGETLLEHGLDSVLVVSTVLTLATMAAVVSLWMWLSPGFILWIRGRFQRPADE